MESKYKELGFKKPDYVENRYGIKIYLGTKDKDDWCVEIPKELLQTNPKYPAWNNKNMAFFNVTEKVALEIAEDYTKRGKCIKEKTQEKLHRSLLDEESWFKYF